MSTNTLYNGRASYHTTTEEGVANAAWDIDVNKGVGKAVVTTVDHVATLNSTAGRMELCPLWCQVLNPRQRPPGICHLCKHHGWKHECLCMGAVTVWDSRC